MAWWRRDRGAPRGSETTRPTWVASARVSLLTRPGCHLCDDARDVVARVARETGTTWEEVSILEHEDLLEEYSEQIPVTFVDGQRHDYWRVDEARLRATLGADGRESGGRRTR